VTAAGDPHPRPVTGDDVVDGALDDLDRRLAGDGDPVEAVVDAHRALQQRLNDPGTSNGPGQARPGPPG